MNRVYLKGFFGCALFFVFLFNGCSKPQSYPWVETSYYYWKSALNLNDDDGLFLTQNHIQRFYIRFFDLDWDDNKKAFAERAPLTLGQIKALPPEVVPVIFITPTATKHLVRRQQKNVAQEIITRCQDLLAKMNGKSLSEIQIDCDWTPSTRENYFEFLKGFRALLSKGEKPIVLTATIRLHQVKYRNETGIPPVDRGVLMIYNSSTPLDWSDKNSILDESDARSYLKNISRYPLPLDIALPLYRWGAQYNNSQRFIRLFRLNPKNPEIAKSFTHLSGILYQADRDVYLGDIRFMQGDYLKVNKAT